MQAVDTGPLELDRLDGLEVLTEDWSRLAEASGNVFSTPEWAEVWWRHYGEERDLRVVALREAGGGVAGILPLYLNRSRPLRVLRFIGHGAADQLGPVCAPADRGRVAAALREVLRDRDTRADLLVGDRLSAVEGWSRLSGARVLLSEPSPTLAIDGQSWDEFLATKSKNFRDQVRRRERKLAKSHDLAFRLSDTERLDEDLRHPDPPARRPLAGSVGGLRARPRGLPPRVRRRRRSIAAGCGSGSARWTAAPWRPGTGCATRVPSASTSRGATPSGTGSRWGSSSSPTASAPRSRTG